MPKQETDRGVTAWLRRWWRALVAELVATGLLVLLGIASLLPVGGIHPPLTHPAFAFGLVVLVNLEVFGPVSGAHMNPAITLAALLDRRIGLVPAIAYVLAQLVGGVLGFAALMALAPAFFPAGEVTGGTAPAPGLAPLAAMCVEALLTAVLALLCCAIWTARDQHGHDPSVPVKFGLTVTGVVYAGGMLTGTGINPVHSLAPALMQGFRPDHWVYWVGPLGGSALGTLLHRLALRPALPSPPSPAAERLPLHDKPGH